VCELLLVHVILRGVKKPFFPAAGNVTLSGNIIESFPLPKKSAVGFEGSQLAGKS
jgi:hypothetical protein